MRAAPGCIPIWQALDSRNRRTPAAPLADHTRQWSQHISYVVEQSLGRQFRDNSILAARALSTVAKVQSYDNTALAVNSVFYTVLVDSLWLVSVPMHTKPRQAITRRTQRLQYTETMQYSDSSAGIQ